MTVYVIEDHPLMRDALTMSFSNMQTALMQAGLAMPNSFGTPNFEEQSEFVVGTRR